MNRGCTRAAAESNFPSRSASWAENIFGDDRLAKSVGVGTAELDAGESKYCPSVSGLVTANLNLDVLEGFGCPIDEDLGAGSELDAMGEVA